MHVSTAKITHGTTEVLVISTNEDDASRRKVQLSLKVGNFTISMAEAVCLKKALDIVVDGR